MPRIMFDGPGGPEVHDLPFDLRTFRPRLTLAEARHIQRVADLTVKQLVEGVFGEDPDPVAVTALVQVMWKRAGTIVSFDQVDFDFGTFTVELLPEEEAAAAEAESGSPETAADAEDPTQTTPSGSDPAGV